MNKGQRIAFAAIAGFAVVRAVAVSVGPSASDAFSAQQNSHSQSCRYDGEATQSNESEPPSMKADPLGGQNSVGKAVGLVASQGDILRSLKTISSLSAVVVTAGGKLSAGRQLCA